MKLFLVAALLLVTAPALAEEAPIPSLPPEVGLAPPDPSSSFAGFPRKAPYPGTEQALRHQIEAIEAGQPDYDAMAPKTAQELRQRIAAIRPSLVRQWGALLSLQYKPLWNARSGLDVYEARFEHARVRWEIARPNAQGNITGIAFRTLS